MSSKKIYISLKKAISSRNIPLIIELFNQISDIDDINSINSNKIIFKLISLLNQDKELAKFTTEIRTSCIDSIEKISSELANRQLSLWLFTEDFITVQIAYDLLFNEEVKCFNNSMANYIVCFEEWLKRQNKAIDYENLSTLHKSLGLYLDFNKSFIFLTAKACKVLNIDINASNIINKALKFHKSSNCTHFFDKMVYLTSIVLALNDLYDKSCFGEYKISFTHKENAHYTFEYCDKNFMSAKYISLRMMIAKNKKDDYLLTLLSDVKEDIKWMASYRGLTHEQGEEIINNLSNYFDFQTQDYLLLTSQPVIFLIRLIVFIYAFCAIEQVYAIKHGCLEDRYWSFFDMNFFTLFCIANNYFSEEQVNVIFDQILIKTDDSSLSIYKKLLRFPIFHLFENTLLFCHSLPLSTYGYSEILHDILNTKNDAKSILIEKNFSNDYGKSFNDMVKGALEHFGWECIGIDIKLKKNKRVLTDIDIIAYQKDTIILVQVKCIINSIDIYNHFKARLRIEEGINQARISVEHFASSDRYSQLLKTNSIENDEIKHIIPIIITNSDTFTGWRNSELIPILSIDYWYLLNKKMEHYNYFEFLNLLTTPYYFNEHLEEIPFKKTTENIMNLFTIEFEDI